MNLWVVDIKPWHNSAFSVIGLVEEIDPSFEACLPHGLINKIHILWEPYATTGLYKYYISLFWVIFQCYLMANSYIFYKVVNLYDFCEG